MASTIIPAQEPKAGNPPASRSDQRLAELEDVQQPADGRRLTAGDDDAVEIGQFGSPAGSAGR